MNRFVITAMLGLASVAAYAQTGDAGKMANDGKMAAGKMADGAMKGPDKKFAMTVAQSDMAELQISNMALQKSQNDQVKKIAQKLIDDHTKSSDALKQLASTKGMTLPAETDAKHQALATKLQGESGDKFDKDYIAANSADHHKVVALFQKESSSGTDPDIKGFATQFLPAIQEHTQMIDQAKSSMK
jgi:putative membrane protein